MGSSIIFLLVIAIWAVFLLPDLQTRRHQLAESRATHRMLSTSRILKRDNPFRQQRDAAGEPARVALTAKPAGSHAISASTPAPATSPEAKTEALDMGKVLAASGAHPAVVTEAAATEAVPAVASDASSEGEAEPSVGAGGGAGDGSAEDTSAEVRRTEKAPKDEKPRKRAKGGRKTVASILASLLLMGLIAVPTTVVLSALQLVPWWSVGVALAVLVAGLAGLRLRARRRAAARRALKVEGVVVPSSATKDAELPATESMPQARRDSGTFDQDAPTAQERQLVEEFMNASQPVHGPTAPPSNPRPMIDDRPGQWTPQPVPRPRYLMKPRAPEGPLVAPNLGVTDDTSGDPFADLLSGDDDLDLPQSRAV